MAKVNLKIFKGRSRAFNILKINAKFAKFKEKELRMTSSLE